MVVNGMYVSTCDDNHIERADENGNKVYCEGVFCQVYSDSEYTNEVDTFCLAVGFEITDTSDEAIETGIRNYFA